MLVFLLPDNAQWSSPIVTLWKVIGCVLSKFLVSVIMTSNMKRYLCKTSRTLLNYLFIYLFMYLYYMRLFHDVSVKLYMEYTEHYLSSFIMLWTWLRIILPSFIMRILMRILLYYSACIIFVFTSLSKIEFQLRLSTCVNIVRT